MASIPGRSWLTAAVLTARAALPVGSIARDWHAAKGDAWSPERIAGNSKRFRFCFQLREVSGDFARQRFQDHGLCRFTDSLQGAKPLIGGQAFQFADFECGDCLGGATECSDAIRRRL